MVTTIVVVILGTLIAVFLVHAIKAARIVKHGVMKVKETVDDSSHYIEEVKDHLVKHGILLTLLRKIASNKKKKK